MNDPYKNNQSHNDDDAYCNEYNNDPSEYQGDNDDDAFDPDQLAAELAALPVSELKRLLLDQGMDYRDCLEKSDLIERLLLAACNLPADATTENDDAGQYQQLVIHQSPPLPPPPPLAQSQDAYYMDPQAQQQDARFMEGDTYTGDGYYCDNGGGEDDGYCDDVFNDDNPEAPFAAEEDQSDDKKSKSKMASWMSSRCCRLFLRALATLIILVVVLVVVYFLEIVENGDEGDDDGENNTTNNIFAPTTPVPTASQSPSAAPITAFPTPLPTVPLPTATPTTAPTITDAPTFTPAPTTSGAPTRDTTATAVPTMSNSTDETLMSMWVDYGLPLEAREIKAMSSDGRVVVLLLVGNRNNGDKNNNTDATRILQVFESLLEPTEENENKNAVSRAATSRTTTTDSPQWRQLGQDLVYTPKGDEDEQNAQFGRFAAVSADGRIVAIGTTHQPIEVVWYDGKSNQWYPMGGPILPQWDSTAMFENTPALTANGQILAARSNRSVATWKWDTTKLTWQARGQTINVEDILTLRGEIWQEEFNNNNNNNGEFRFDGSVVLSADGTRMAIGVLSSSTFPVSVLDWDEPSQTWKLMPSGPYVNTTEVGADSASITPFALSEYGSIVATTIFQAVGESGGGFQTRVWEWDNAAGVWQQLGGTLGGTGNKANHDWLRGMALSADGKTALGETSSCCVYYGEDNSDVEESIVRAFRYERNHGSIYQWKQLGGDFKPNHLISTVERMAMSGNSKIVAIGWAPDSVYYPNATNYVKLTTLTTMAPTTIAPTEAKSPTSNMTPTVLPTIQPNNSSTAPPTQDQEEPTINITEYPSSTAPTPATEDPSWNETSYNSCDDIANLNLDFVKGQPLCGERDGDNFGAAFLALSANGNTLMVGAHGAGANRSGLVRVFEFDTRTKNWARLGQDLEGIKVENKFGFAGATSANGRIVAIGAPGRGTNDSVGYVTVYQFNEAIANWEQVGSALSKGDISMGESVALSDDGNRLVVVSFVHIWSFELDSTLQWQELGEPLSRSASDDLVVLSADGTTLAAGNVESGDGNGQPASPVQVFVWNGGSEEWQPRKGPDDAGKWPVGLSKDGLVLATGMFQKVGADDGYLTKVWQFDDTTDAWKQLGQTLGGSVAAQEWVRGRALSGDGMTLLGATGQWIFGDNGVETDWLITAFSYHTPCEERTLTDFLKMDGADTCPVVFLDIPIVLVNTTKEYATVMATHKIKKYLGGGIYPLSYLGLVYTDKDGTSQCTSVDQPDHMESTDAVDAHCDWTGYATVFVVAGSNDFEGKYIDPAALPPECPASIQEPNDPLCLYEISIPCDCDIGDGGWTQSGEVLHGNRVGDSLAGVAISADGATAVGGWRNSDQPLDYVKVFEVMSEDESCVKTCSYKR